MPAAADVAGVVVGPETVVEMAGGGVVVAVVAVVADLVDSWTGPVVLVAAPGLAGVAWLGPECSG